MEGCAAAVAIMCNLISFSSMLLLLVSGTLTSYPAHCLGFLGVIIVWSIRTRIWFKTVNHAAEGINSISFEIGAFFWPSSKATELEARKLYCFWVPSSVECLRR